MFLFNYIVENNVINNLVFHFWFINKILCKENIYHLKNIMISVIIIKEIDAMKIVIIQV